MARRRGFLRKIVDSLFGKRKEVPQPGIIPSSYRPSTPGRQSLKRRAIDNILQQLALANRDAVKQHVDYMSIDELQWTINATASQLVAVARQDADRLTIDAIPLNPWWYH